MIGDPRYSRGGRGGLRTTAPVLLISLAAGCVGGPEIVMLGPAGEEFDPIPPEDVWVFSGLERVRVKHRPIAEISKQLGSWVEVESQEELVFELREAAGELGAHGVILRELESHSEMGWLDLPIPYGVGTAIRFLEPELDRAALAPRLPADLRTIVVAPVAVPGDVDLPDSVAEAFGQDIYDLLREAGYDPLPVETYESVWTEIAKDSKGPKGPEGLLDPITGLKPEGQGQSKEERVIRALVEDHGAEGILLPDIEGVEAYFDGEKARWDGVEQKVGETRSAGAKVVSGLLNLFRTGEHNWSDDATTPTGTVWALSLVIRIENALGAQLYRGRGGLELLEKAEFEGGIWFGEPEPEEYEVTDVPSDELFQKRNRLRRAVMIALTDLRRGG